MCILCRKLHIEEKSRGLRLSLPAGGALSLGNSFDLTHHNMEDGIAMSTPEVKTEEKKDRRNF